MKAAGEMEQIGKRRCYPAFVGTCLTQLPSRGGILEGSSFSWIFATHLCPGAGLAAGRSWHSLGWGHCTQDEPPRHFLRSAPENSASCPKSTGSCTKPMLWCICSSAAPQLGNAASGFISPQQIHTIKGLVLPQDLQNSQDFPFPAHISSGVPQLIPLSMLRIKDYPKLEGTHKDHQFQLLALHRTSQNPTLCLGGFFSMSMSIVQRLLELWQPWGCSSAQPKEGCPALLFVVG